jgi:hypothetical protein
MFKIVSIAGLALLGFLIQLSKRVTLDKFSGF